MVDTESSPAEATCLGETHSRESVTCLVTLAFADAEEELRQNLSNLELEQDDPSSKRSSPLVAEEEDDGSIASELRELEGLEQSVREELREYEGLLLLRQSQEEELQEEIVTPSDPLHVEKVSFELLPVITAAASLESSAVKSPAAVKRFESDLSPIVRTRIPDGVFESPERERFQHPNVPATPTSPDADSASLQETPLSVHVASSEMRQTPTSPDVDPSSESVAVEYDQYPDLLTTPTSPSPKSPSVRESPSPLTSSDVLEPSTSPDAVEVCDTESGVVFAQSKKPSSVCNDDSVHEESPPMRPVFQKTPPGTPSMQEEEEASSLDVSSSDIPESPTSPAVCETGACVVVAESKQPSNVCSSNAVHKENPPMRSIFPKCYRYSVSPIESDESESFYPDESAVEPKLTMSSTDSTASEMSPTESSESSTVEPVSDTQVSSDPLPSQAFEDMLSAAYVQSGHGGMSLALASDMLAAQLNSNPGSILQQWLGRKFQADKSSQPSSPHWILGVPILGSASGTDDVLLMANSPSRRGA